jgi:hypothetical protein
VYLTDLTFTEEGNPDLRPKTTLINFDKQFKIARSIFDLQSFQRPYFLKPLPAVQDWLLKSIEESVKDDAQMYEKSLQLEPRELAAGPVAGSQSLLASSPSHST